MLSNRFKNDGIAIRELSPLQLKYKNRVDKKVKNNQYKFEEIPCSICNSKDFELIAEKDRYGLYCPISICRDCGLVQTNPRMNQEAYNEFYNLEYRYIYSNLEEPNHNYFKKKTKQGENIYTYLSKNGCFKDKKKKFIVEIGCSAGSILYYFKNKGHKVAGVDLNKSFIEFGKENYQLDLSEGMLKDLHITSKPDVIIYSHVFEHVLDLNDELQKLKKISHENTILYIEVPGIKNLKYSYRVDLLRYLQNAHVYHFSLNSLNNIMFKNGYELVQGDEYIKSLYRLKTEKDEYSVINDFELVTSYLDKIERYKFLYSYFSFYGIKNKVKDSFDSVLNLGIQFLEKVHLKDLIRSIIKPKNVKF